MQVKLEYNFKQIFILEFKKISLRNKIKSEETIKFKCRKCNAYVNNINCT